MSLIDDVKTVCDRLAPRGWRNLLLSVTNNALDISQPTAARLQTALTRSLPAINRTRMGFGDFSAAGTRAITGGRPSRSLLYHALASSGVHPTANGAPSANPADYPTLLELDIIENFIYSLVAGRTDLANTFIAVFSYQYREASRTPHLRHADMAFSRTGVARVGTAAAHYDASRRSFWIVPAGGGDTLAVLPARYGVFLAGRARPGAAGSVQGGHRGAADDNFIFPMHKLFSGTECLNNRTINVSFLEFHRNEKLRMTHGLTPQDGGLSVPAGFNTGLPPFVRDSRNGGNLINLQGVGSSVLVVPNPGALVRTVSQTNSLTNRNQIVHFIVPPQTVIRGSETRFTESTLEIPAFGADRLAPEYVNIRHEIDPAGPVTQTPIDLNLLSGNAFSAKIRQGDYPAAHFADDSCDGCVEAVVSGLAVGTENRPAFSLVTAPDFFPLADQFEVETDASIIRVAPLSRGRLPINPTIPRPSNPTAFAFQRNDRTVTAVVGAFATGTQVPIRGRLNRLVSFLPDAASNVFAPGWDTSRSRDAVGAFLTSSGLGSPFPEDAKLCAALASFWPAVAPDNGRTFGNQGFGNQLPMLDEELGFHPGHERVRSGELVSYRGWDGEFGPFFETDTGRLLVNYVAIERSDYVSHALAGRIKASLTAEVQSEDLIARHQALNACENILQLPQNANVCLVVARRIADWAVSGRGSAQLTGPGFLLEFAELRGGELGTAEFNRVRREVRKRHICQFGTSGIAYKNGNAAFRFIPA